MAQFRIFGPYRLNFGTGLAPGATWDTHWYGWSPEVRQFTVTVTARPSIVTPAGGTAETRLGVLETVVASVPGSVAGSSTPVIHAKLVNRGASAIRDATLYITFHEL
jgi:hypothetical protein